MIVSGGATLSNSNVRDTGTLVVSAGGTFETTSGGAAIIAGDVTNSGTLLAGGSNSLLEITAGASVHGAGIIEIGFGVAKLGGVISANVLFEDDGGLDIADTKATPTAYTGTISGFGADDDTIQYIDLTGVTFVGGAINGNFSGNTLTVTSGVTTVAEIKFAGTYTTGDFSFSSGPGDTVEITDPVPSIAGGSVTTLASTGNGAAPGTGNVALLGSYMASLFAGPEGQVAAPPMATETAHNEAVLAHPHTG